MLQERRIRNFARNNPSLAKAIKILERLQDAHDKKCIRCGKCCCTASPITLEESDIFRISKHLRMSKIDFERMYVRKHEQGKILRCERPCAFLILPNICEIYDARPNVCRSYPYLSQNSIYNLASTGKINTNSLCPMAEVEMNMRESGGKR